MAAAAEANLLNADALANLCIAISASESEDLARLGLVEMHFRLALGEIARCVITAGGKLAYGGHLDPEGYTAFLIQELHRYSRRDRPLRVCLAWPEHRRLALDALEQQQDELGLYGEIAYLDPDGTAVRSDFERGAEPAPVQDTSLVRRSLTSLRECMAKMSHARILIGGRRTGFRGVLPGLVEEALITLKHGQPLYLVGGFGGVTFDIIRALGIDSGEWLPPLPDAANDERLETGIAELRAIAAAEGWLGLNNGLADGENRYLAATPRPSEIATLVSLGLGRRFVRSG
jgi:hypothetical protein